MRPEKKQTHPARELKGSCAIIAEKVCTLIKSPDDLVFLSEFHFVDFTHD